MQEDYMDDVIKAVAINPRITTVDLSKNGFQDNDMEIVAGIFKNCKGLASFNFSDNEIPEASTEKLFESAVNHAHALTEFYYNENEVKDVMGKKCLDLALKLPKLKMLEMKRTISDELGKEYERKFRHKGIDFKYEKIEA